MIDWKAVANEYRRLYEASVGANCEPRFAMTAHGKWAVEETHKMLDKVVADHTEEIKCSDCKEPAEWVRMTQFSGNHYFCLVHAEQQEDFDKEDPSYFIWKALEKGGSDA